MKKMIFAALIALTYAMTSCSPFSLVYSEEYKSADITDYNTFRFAKPAEGSIAPGVEMVTYQNIVAAIRAQLLERGYKEDPKSPLLVNLGFTVKNEVQAQAVPVGPYYVYGGMPWPEYAPYFIASRYDYFYDVPATAVVTDVYQKGVLIMDLVNVKEKKPVYSAAVSAVLDDNDAKYRDLKAINEAIAVLFSKFPITPLPKYKKK
ncbi:MAG: DUF4136 domain-containing protein [Muribaculaceae bacterium]|nr:DUF4136 domain-containing protein [Muribaculaceae bacterium]